MKKLLLKSMLLLCALIAGSSSVWATKYTGTFNQITSASDFTTGYYVITGSGYDKALGTEINSNKRMPGQNVTISNNTITDPDETIVWYITRTSNTCTFQNVSNEKYLSQVSTTSGKGMGFSNTSVNITYSSYSSGFAFTLNGASNNIFKYNSSSDWFANYTGDYTSSMTRVDLFKLHEDETGESTTVTINSTGITNTNKFYGTAAGTLTAAVTVTSTSAAVAGATITWLSSNTSVATVGETTGVVTLVGEGSTTITASYAGETGVYQSASAKYELIVTNDNPNAVTLWSEDFSGYSEGDKPSGGTYNYVCVDGGTNTQIYEAVMAGGTSPELLVNKNGGSFSATIPLENIVGDMKLKFKSNAYAVTVSTSTTGISISGDNSFNTAGEHTVTFTGVTTAMTSVVITFAAGSSNVRIDDIVLKGSKVVPATITAAEYATFNSPYALDFSETGITVYTATDNETSVALNEIVSGKVPANTPIVLYKAGADGTAINVPVIASATAIEGTNDLNVSDGTTTLTNAYVLANKAQGVGFYPWGGTTLSAGKVYLQGTSAAREFLGFENGTTAIETVKTQKVDGQYYDLQGRMVSNPTKGLYIVNGKKVIIK
jgi:hypothetical protein